MAEIRFSATNLFLSVNVTEFDKGKNWKIVDIVTNFSGNIYWIAKHQQKQQDSEQKVRMHKSAYNFTTIVFSKLLNCPKLSGDYLCWVSEQNRRIAVLSLSRLEQVDRRADSDNYGFIDAANLINYIDLERFWEESCPRIDPCTPIYTQHVLTEMKDRSWNRNFIGHESQHDFHNKILKEEEIQKCGHYLKIYFKESNRLLVAKLNDTISPIV